jgi:hypothetical protein
MSLCGDHLLSTAARLGDLCCAICAAEFKLCVCAFRHFTAAASTGIALSFTCCVCVLPLLLLPAVSFFSGAVSVLCATSTLAAGINLPARRVVFRDMWLGRPQQIYTPSEYHQMAGRAGRAGEPEGC